jgi:glycogen synthase
MKVLMFGWEFPPYSNGGLGTACQGLTKGLKNNNIKVTFVLPKAPIDAKSDNAELISASNLFHDESSDLEFKEINSLIIPYLSFEEYSERYRKYSNIVVRTAKEDEKVEIYGKNLNQEVQRYAEKAKLVAKMTKFDIIHAHDWMTYKAGINAKQLSGKPLVVHVHATEFDRTGGNPNQHIYNIEREGMHAADSIITVSYFTKQKIIQHYGVDPEKINVVHNAVEFNDDSKLVKEEREKNILFLGRLTLQKGPEYFLYAAKKVLEIDPDVNFTVAGSGDMEGFMRYKAEELGINDKVRFTGFLRGKEIDDAYKLASVYVMPSISEPFGITPLEAMRNGTPTIISKQSGVSEVIKNTLAVDFWDINQLANHMYALVNYNHLNEEISNNGHSEVYKISWDEPARKCVDVYSKTIRCFN